MTGGAISESGTETVRDMSALRAFREVGRHGSIAAAAAALGTTQQALSARMRTLERVTGLRLLTRTPTGSHLTDQGKLVLGWSEEVLDAADRLEAGIASIRSGVTHRLTIAASQTNAEHLVPHWLIELRAAEEGNGLYPTVVELLVGNSTSVIELVRNGNAELGFIETPHIPNDLVKRHLRDDELLVVVASGHRWARRRKPLTFTELAATPLVMREAGSGTRDTLTDYLAACDPPLTATPAIELGTSAAVRSAIAAGVAPGVLSRLAVRDDLVLGRLAAVEVDGPPLHRELTAVWRGELSPEGDRLLAVASAGPGGRTPRRLDPLRPSGLVPHLGGRPFLRADRGLERGGVDVEPLLPRVRAGREPGEAVEAVVPAGGVPRRPAGLEPVGENQSGAPLVRVQLECEGFGVAPGVGEELRLVDGEDGAGERHVDDVLRERERDLRADGPAAALDDHVAREPVLELVPVRDRPPHHLGRVGQVAFQPHGGLVARGVEGAACGQVRHWSLLLSRCASRRSRLASQNLR
jgi:DNA-binding transcriptional LysR family regulator